MGADFYKAAMIDLDQAALGGAQMAEAFDQRITLRSYVDDNFSGRDWNLASAMVINGEAGMQMMGNWAKGEFIKAGKVPGTGFVCIRFPDTQGSVTFNSDQFARFGVAEDGAKASQAAMAQAIMDPVFQSACNVVKGAVPAGTLFGSAAHWHASPAVVKNAMYDVVTAA